VKAEEVANEIVNSPELLQKIVDKVYEKLREDVIIKRLESIEDEIKKLYEQQIKILEKLDEHTRILNEHTEKLDEHTRILNEHSRKLDEHTEKLDEHTKMLGDQKQELDNIDRNLKDQIKILEDHTQRLTDMQSSINRLQDQVGRYTSRSGHRVERTMMELYKEALKLHGVDPDKVKHGYIVDDKGVIDQQGDKYEVDFYEVTDGEVYIFEVKTNGDRGAIEQLVIRKKLFESQGKKVTKMFLVCHVINKKAKKLADQKGITVIAGSVV